MHLRIGHRKQCIRTVDKGRAGCPSATSVSIFGAPMKQTFKAADKELLIDHHDDDGQQKLQQVPSPHDCPQAMPAIGQFHIIWPIDKYISGTRKQSDAISRFFRTGVSVSFRKSSHLGGTSCSDFSRSFHRSSVSCLFHRRNNAALVYAVPSTPIEFVKRLTEQDVTPGYFQTPPFLHGHCRLHSSYP